MVDLVRYLFEKAGFKVEEGALVSKQDDKGEAITLTLGHADISRFASSEGRLMRSFRTLLSAAAAVKNTTVVLEIVEKA
jgi:predicted RNA-binding protein YlqC (UPF0109 family)